MQDLPSFSIATPSYRMLDGLHHCARSIADQEGVQVQHIVQDSCSPGIEATQAQLEDLTQASSTYDCEVHVEKDSGIYQAVNRGLARANHDYLAYLNCDEQYLPGALAKVARHFEKHPDVDVVFGDLVFIQEDGQPIYYQKTILPRRPIIHVSHLPVFTCATFFRRRVYERFPFREDLQGVSDACWVLDLLKEGVKMDLLGSTTSIFTCTDDNHSTSDSAFREKRALFDTAPQWMRRFPQLVTWAHRFEKACHGCYTFPPRPYQIYQPGLPHRHTFCHGSRH